MSILPNYSDIITAASDGKDLEIEVKFGKYYGQEFSSNLGKQIFFQRALDYMKAKGDELNLSKYIDRRWDSGLRQRTDVDSGVETWIVKQRSGKDFEIRSYDMRLSMSYEVSTSPVSDDKPDVLRNITRYSTNVGSFRIDLSTVKSKYNIKPGKKPKADTTTFELEVEILPEKTVNESLLEDLNSLLVDLFRVVKDTDNIYTTEEVSNLNKMVNRALGMGITPADARSGSEKFDIFRQFFNDARNLRKYDMVDGGLCGKKDQMYYVTDKADGERKLLCFDETGVWIVFTGSHNLIHRGNFNQMKEYILEGEYIPRDEQHRLRGPDGVFLEPEHAKRHVMYIYDAISVRELGFRVQNIKHSERMHHVDLFLSNLVDIPDLFVQRKNFLGLTYETMYERIRWMLDYQYPYPTDGLMFVPDSNPYDIWRDYKLDRMTENAKKAVKNESLAILPPLKTRNLKDNDDICKWKPPSQITIDLKVVFNEKRPDIVELWTEKIRTPVEFKGSDWYPLKWENGLNPNDAVLYPNGIRVESGTIVECSYVDASDASEAKTKRRESKYQLVAVRIRHDKSKPNQYDVVLDNWDLAHDSLPLHTMRGEGTILMHFYHNDIKRELWSSMPSGSTVLDIGSGRGADLSKWNHLGYVFAVEPFSGWIEIFKSRLATSKNKDKVQLIETGAEDVDRIIDVVRKTKGRVDYITFMLSLTFFWQSELMLRNVAYLIQETLKPGGKVVFLTMDGDVVNNYFYPPFGASEANTELKTDYIHLCPKDDHFYIDLKDSQVRDQEEYAAIVDDLAILLEGTLSKVRADKRMILNKWERILSNMYSYGEITIGTQIKKITKPERAINKMSFPVLQVQQPTVDKQVDTLEKTFDKLSVSRQDTSVRTMLTSEVMERIAFDIPFPTYRLRTVGDGSCYLHALLQGFSRTYNNPNIDPSAKANFVYMLRSDIANKLTDTFSHNLSYWSVYGNGKWSVRFTAQLADAQDAYNARLLNPDDPSDNTIDQYTGKPFKDPRVFKYHKVDSSELGMVNYIRARDAYLEYDIFDLISDVLGIDTFVFELTKDNARFLYTTAAEGRYRKAVLIGAVKSNSNAKRVDHFETMGIEFVDGTGKISLQTIFDNNAVFLNKYPKQDPNNIFGADAFQKLLTIAIPEITEIMKRILTANVTPETDRLIVFKYHRQFFSISYEFIITHVLRSLGVGEDMWPSTPQAEFVPVGFGSQNEVRKALGLPTTTNERNNPKIGVY